MQAQAQVLQVEPGRVRLRVSNAGGGCGRCDEPGGCRSVQITQAFGLPKAEFWLPSELVLAPGDRVLIAIPDGGALKAAMASYGLGAVLLLLGAAAGVALSGEGMVDAAAAVGGALGLGFAYDLNRLLFRSRSWRTQLQMKLAPEAACLHSFEESR
jgi:sigma-E factor negative regulatory protein RseC